MFVIGGSRNNITNNTITGTATASTAVGLRFNTLANNNTARGNTIRGAGSGGAGILIGTANGTFINNTVISATWIQTFAGSSNAFFNTTFLNTENGSIRLDNFTLLEENDITISNLTINTNAAFVNTTQIPQINSSGQVTLEGLVGNDVDPIVDFEDDGTFATCSSPQCVEDSFSGGSFVFNVSSFTTYSTLSVLACGDSVTADTNLTKNLTCVGEALTVTGHNVLFDCKGFNITYRTSSDSSSFAIKAENVSNLTIQNCGLFDSGTGGSGSVVVNKIVFTCNSCTLCACACSPAREGVVVNCIEITT